MSTVEKLYSCRSVCCYIIRPQARILCTEFYTEHDAPLQVGYIAHNVGHKIPRHYHSRIKRTVIGTSEVLFVQSGSCELDVYDDEGTLIATRVLNAGEIAILSGCGHSLRMLEDTILLEVKQGPYCGPEEKILF